MPKLYDYLGIYIWFYNNEHDPIHVHGKYQGRETKAEIHLKNGKLDKIVLKDKGSGLPPEQKKNFRVFVEKYYEDIVEKWVDFHILKKTIKPRKITRKV